MLGQTMAARAGPASRLAAAKRTTTQYAAPRRWASSTSGAGELKKTPLYDLHVANGGKMVPFAGYSMPVQYSSASLAQSHNFTRTQASLFDVSHMVQHRFKGSAAAAFLERVTPSSWSTQPGMQGKLTTLLWPGTGGIVDDTVIARTGEDEFYVVTNGACLDKDTAYFDEELGRFGGDVAWTRIDGSGLVALQGPGSADILRSVLADETAVDLSTVYFGGSFWAKLKLADGSVSHPVLVSRGGYTGEDGFELSFQGDRFPALESTPAAVRALLDAAGPDRLQLSGLGARDSLRLEAGMCLYGHDLDDTTTPAEAGLGWVIPKERRSVDAGFHGAEVVVPQLTPRSKGGAGVDRRRVGLTVKGAPAREGAEIHVDGEKVGVVTSGSPSPTLGVNIAMGYVKDGLHKAGTEVDVVVRGKKRDGVVAKMPFVPAKFVRKP